MFTILNHPEIEHTNLSQKIYEKLRKAILSYELKAGERLFPDKLSQEMKISRTPIKQALQRLVHEDLLSFESRKGFFVKVWTNEEIKEAFEFRLALELFALKKGITSGIATELSNEYKNLLNNVIVEDEHTGSSLSYESWKKLVESDVNLHRIIISMAQNRKISEAFEQINAHMKMLRVIDTDRERPKESRKEHKVILESILANDLTQAEKVLTEHITTSMKMSLEILTKNI